MPTFTGTNASEQILGTDEIDIIHGAGGDDQIAGFGANDELHGDDGNDAIHGGDGDDVVFGGSGTDLMAGGAGQDVLRGGDGNDGILIGAGDTVFGEAGDDLFEIDVEQPGLNITIDGGAGYDWLNLYEANAPVVYMDGATGTAPGLRVAGVERVTLGGTGGVVFGGSADDRIEGSYGVSVEAHGGGGADHLIGQGQADRLFGDAGDDQLFVAGVGGRIDGGDGYDVLAFDARFGPFTVDMGGLHAATITGIEEIQGSAFGDVLRGGAAGEVLNGGAGDDVLEGGDGDDRLIGGAGNDTLSYASAHRGVTVNLNLTHQTNEGLGTDYTEGFEQVIGSAFDDVLTGNAGDNIFRLGAGSDRIEGGAGYDVVLLDDPMWEWNVDSLTYDGQVYRLTRRDGGVDVLTGVEALSVAGRQPILLSQIGLTLRGTDAGDTITGTGAGDRIFGGAGDDILDAGGGAAGGRDYLYGEAGDDHLTSYGYAELQGGEGADVLVGAVSSVGEPFFQTSEFLYGGAGDDVIHVHHSSSFVSGGEGNDTLVYEGSGVFTYNTDAAERLVLGGSANSGATMSLFGQWAADITGNAGANRIEGGGGDDVLRGLAGDDVLIGQGGSNILEGGTGDDVLDTRGGVAQADGGDGVDTAVLSGRFSDWVLGLQDGAMTLQYMGVGQTQTLRGVEMLQFDDGTFAAPTSILDGTPQADTIVGTAGGDFINGRDGDDVITGAGGGDRISGGFGADRFVYGAGDSTAVAFDTLADFGLGDVIDLSGAAPGRVVVSLGVGESYIYFAPDGSGGFGGVIRLIGQIEGGQILSGGLGVTMFGGAAGEQLTGSDQGDTLAGGAGGDVLFGGLGADILSGGEGSDTFQFREMGETPITGADYITDFESGVDALTFHPNMTSSGPVSVYRSGGASFIYTGLDNGAYQSAVIVAGLVQGADMDIRQSLIMIGDGASETLSGQVAYENVLYGMGGDDQINGGYRDDILMGGDGADIIYGGGGRDLIYGGEGADTFVYLSALDSAPHEFDAIADFVSGQDRIDLAMATAQGGYDNFALARFGGSTFVYLGRLGANEFEGVIQVLGEVQGADLVLGSDVGLVLYGSEANDDLRGGAGGDTILGGAGADVIVGGAGADSLFGGAGADVFDYTALRQSTASAYDTIQDFEVGIDTIDLRGVASSVVLSSFGGATFIYFHQNPAGGHDSLIVVAGAALTQDDILVTGEGVAALESKSSALTLPGLIHDDPQILPQGYSGKAEAVLDDIDPLILPTGFEGKYASDPSPETCLPGDVSGPTPFADFHSDSLSRSLIDEMRSGLHVGQAGGWTWAL